MKFAVFFALCLFVSSCIAATCSSGTAYKVKTSGSPLNVRNYHSTSGKFVRTVANGSTVCVVSISSGWAKLTDGNYVSASYIVKASSGTSSKSPTTPTPSTSQSTVSTPSTSTTTVAGDRLDSSPRPKDVTENSKKCVYYAQGDKRWGSLMYSNHKDKSQTYANSACGPTSMAMIVATLADKTVTPVTMGDYAMKHGYRTYNSGTSWNFFCNVAKNYNLSCTATSTTNDVVAALKEGKLAVASMGPGYFTKGGHFIMLHSVVGDNIIVHDPAKTTRYQASISLFKRESSNYWIISKK